MMRSGTVKRSSIKATRSPGAKLDGIVVRQLSCRSRRCISHTAASPQAVSNGFSLAHGAEQVFTHDFADREFIIAAVEQALEADKKPAADLARYLRHV